MALKYCPNCKQRVDTKRNIRHGLHVFFSIITGGLWFLFVYLWILIFGSNRCPICNTRHLSNEKYADKIEHKNVRIKK